MGSANSKVDNNQALGMCKARKKFIRQTIESRYLLAAAHLSYTQSLRNIGIALRRYAEAEIPIESSLSTSATELEKTPSHCSYPSPSPSHVVDALDSPSPPVVARLSYMKFRQSAPVAVVLDPVMETNASINDGNASLALPPPPPPFQRESGASWDFFHPIDETESFRFAGPCEVDLEFDDLKGWSQFKEANTNCSEFNSSSQPDDGSYKELGSGNDGLHAIQGTDAAATTSGLRKGNGECNDPEKEKPVTRNEVCAEREDPSEFITHRAKDFLSSIKDIEHKFFRASESGKEMSRMLEANKVRIGMSDTRGQSSSSAIKAACQLVCCRKKQGTISHESGQEGMKMIVWKRSTSSTSSSSRNPLAGAVKDDVSESGSDFFEDFCMISGSHSSTLERLYAWERKIYDEVKASESIRKVYDRRCHQLRHQFAKGCRSQVIDKTRVAVKDLHSRIIVALHSVDSISKRIEKMRDEELQPQLVELVHGFIRMWKAMLECHHTQYITISLAYHSRSLSGSTPRGGEGRRQVMSHLRHEIECFRFSFSNWVNSLTSYIEALNGWLQNCILLPPESRRIRNRRPWKPWSPRTALAPPIFVLCRDWLEGLKKTLSGHELSDALKEFLSDIHDLIEEEVDNGQQKAHDLHHHKGSIGDPAVVKDEERSAFAPSNLSCVQSSLTKVLDRMTKYSEAALKMYEDVKQKNDTATTAYSNCRPARSKTV
ncbi:hypothetical protein SAY86_015080 [Trapa natans]|uniref:Uncharacterized protein n=1 Tax=Trapa natans TaxID=22666 RepID=A0AAN7QK25_TRANT|nr:hypothetical protein SAY86_015080 [Trapa natans]